MDTPQSTETKRLLARVGVVQNPCSLDLLVFLHRHPRTLLTSEHLAEFVGYPLKEIAKALDTFIESGLLGRTVQHSGHAARMFQLLLQSPHGGDVKRLLDQASTRPGRQAILEALNGPTSSPATQGSLPALKLVKCG